MIGNFNLSSLHTRVCSAKVAKPEGSCFLTGMASLPWPTVTPTPRTPGPFARRPHLHLEKNSRVIPRSNSGYFANKLPEKEWSWSVKIWPLALNF